MEDFSKEARDFLDNAQQFRLGFLASEARNPLTMNLDRDFSESAEKGVRTLLACDNALRPHFAEALKSPVYAEMIRAMRSARHIVFSGCGATGRLAILLESAWNEVHPDDPKVFSIMTGGDYALIRSVEHFEDCPEVGRRQLRDLNFTGGDVFIGITATGETASILGSAQEAARIGAEVFMLICVPVSAVSGRLDRCRELYSCKNVHVIAMSIGGMAVTGSTRMQSSTIEQLVAASALEKALCGSGIDYADAFENLLNGLMSPVSLKALAECIDFETDLYRRHGLIDYLPKDMLVDLLSDTTERSPTFMIPPYKSADDPAAPEPWAMVRDPDLTIEEFWRQCLHRELRCLEWSAEDYRKEGLAFLMKNGLPGISRAELFKIPIAGKEPESRKNALQIRLDNDPDGAFSYDGRPIGAGVVRTPLRLFEHLRVKLAMNIISTGTMVKFGRVRSNYMIHLAISNKKLIDRACRIISELCAIPYEQACFELFKTRASIDSNKISPVAETIRRLNGE